MDVSDFIPMPRATAPRGRPRNSEFNNNTTPSRRGRGARANNGRATGNNTNVPVQLITRLINVYRGVRKERENFNFQLDRLEEENKRLKARLSSTLGQYDTALHQQTTHQDAQIKGLQEQVYALQVQLRNVQLSRDVVDNNAPFGDDFVGDAESGDGGVEEEEYEEEEDDYYGSDDIPDDVTIMQSNYVPRGRQILTNYNTAPYGGVDPVHNGPGRMSTLPDASLLSELEQLELAIGHQLGIQPTTSPAPILAPPSATSTPIPPLVPPSPAPSNAAVVTRPDISASIPEIPQPIQAPATPPFKMLPVQLSNSSSNIDSDVSIVPEFLHEMSLQLQDTENPFELSEQFIAFGLGGANLDF